MHAADPLVRGRVVRANVSLATSYGSHGIMARVPGVEVSSSAPRLFVPSRAPCWGGTGTILHFTCECRPIYRSSGSAAFVAGNLLCAVLPLCLLFVSESFLFENKRDRQL